MRALKQRPIKFDNACGCIVDLKELERAMLWYSPLPMNRIKKIFLYGRYPGVAIGNDKMHVHRLLMSFWEGRRLNKDEVVHHKNHNRFDATRENLEIMNYSLHQSMHNKGKTISDEHKAIISKCSLERWARIKEKQKNIHTNEK